MKKLVILLAISMLFPLFASSTKSLVVYFSATGNTRKVAEAIAEAQGADIFEIQPSQAYTSQDLDYGNRHSRSSVEMNDPSSRPAIAKELENLSDYDTIYLGYPIWWSDMPRILYTFLDEYDLTGKKIAPFCTSGGSGLSGTERTIRNMEREAEVLKGLSIRSSRNLDSTLNKWFNEIGL